MIEVRELTKDYGDGVVSPNSSEEPTTTGIIVFDEPVNGLHPEGLHRIRDLMLSLAARGRTVLVSSRQVSEMVPSTDHLLSGERDDLLTEISTTQLTERCRPDVYVRSPRGSGLARVLTGMGATVVAEPGGGLSVTGMDAWRIASAAAAHWMPIQELTPRSASLADAYLEPTNGSVECRVQPQTEGALRYKVTARGRADTWPWEARHPDVHPGEC